MSDSKPSSQRRFSGVIKSYGPEAFERFTSAHICVLGIGGVGSWVVEALARSAVGTLTLVDLDIVAESNINRQLHALDETVGRNKINVMRDRVSQINPQAKVNLIDDFVTVDNAEELLSNQFDYVVDCIDNFRVKAAVISVCRKANVPVITIGGAGGKIDPSLIECRDLSRTERDQLLAQTRKLLRQKYQFSRQLREDFKVQAVYSTENLSGWASIDDENNVNASGLSCDSTMGSLAHVTGSFAFSAVAIVLRELSDQVGKR